MLSKKSIKIISIVVMVAIVLFSFASVTCFAEIPSPTEPTDLGNISTLTSKILGIIQWAGIAIAVGMLMFIGIKYITASPDGKAEIKKTAVIYILGAVLIFSASAIVTVIKNNLTIS